MTSARNDPTIGGTATPTRKKHRRTKSGRARSHVSASTAKGGKDWSIPPVNYGRGPFFVPIGAYEFRFWGIRGDESDVVLLSEVETATWEDASAVMTGTLTYRTPDWAKVLGLREGHKIRCEWSDDHGAHHHPLWTLRLDAPNIDLLVRERTANLVSDLNRLAQSDDDFVYAKSKRRPKGWRSDLAIRDILARYGFKVASIPVMKTYITKWHLTDVRPLDVIHSILLRERNLTGHSYALSMDWRERVHVRPVARPKTLWQIGPQLLAATVAAQHDARFATQVTVRSDSGTATTKDAKGHRKTTFSKTGRTVSSPAGVKLYGLIRRNLYSPDATSPAKLSVEGKRFLAAVAKFRRQAAVTVPGIPTIRRLDAFRLKIEDEGLDSIVYVADAKHTADSGRGYTTDVTMVFQDPFVKDKSEAILRKLTDSAVSRSRVPPPGKTKGGGKKPPHHNTRSSTIGGVKTNSQLRVHAGGWAGR